MTTKLKMMKSLARSVTKALKAQGHEISLGAVLNAVAAADGNFNWHVVAAKKDKQVSAPIPEIVWVGVWDRPNGFDVYAADSEEAIRARKTQVALDWFDETFESEIVAEAANWSPQRRAEFYWNNAEGEGYSIHPVKFDRGVLSNKDESNSPSRQPSAAVAKLVESLRETLGHAEDMLMDEKDTDDLSNFPWVSKARNILAAFEGTDATPARPARSSERGVERHQMLVASTGHVTFEESRILEKSGYSRGEYGWLIYIHDRASPSVDEISHPSEGLKGALEMTVRLGCSYLLLDRDAASLEGVPTYDW